LSLSSFTEEAQSHKTLCVSFYSKPMKKLSLLILFFNICVSSFSQKIELPDTTVVQETIIKTPLRISNLTYLYAADIQIIYDHTVVEAMEPELPEDLLNAGFIYSFNIQQAGLYRLYIAGVNPFSTDEGILAHLYFKAIGENGDSTLLEYIQFDVNEISHIEYAQIGKIKIEEEIEPDFIIPNAFTPNNDGYNDFFEIPNISETLKIDIFNQNGELVYHSNQTEIKWDGTLNGKALPEATYFFFLQISNKQIKGSIRLIR